MTENDQNEQEKKAPPVRKAKTGAWWKSVPKAAAAEAAKAAQAAAEAAKAAASTAPVELVAPAVPDAIEERREEVPPVVSPPQPDASAPVADQPLEVIEPVAAESVTEEVATSAADPGVADEAAPAVADAGNEEAAEEPAPPKKRRPRRSGKKRAKPVDASQDTEESAEKERETPVDPAVSDADEDDDSDRVVDDGSEFPDKAVVYKLLINAEEPEECRIALVEDGRLESFHVTTIDREPTKNNIYKGRIVSIEANLQAAFVDIGTGRNGFLPFNEIHPEYYRQDVNERNRNLIAQQQWKKLKIEEVMQKGQEVLVQVVKEVTGNKGANMTTYLSLPGRCLVLMPGSDSSGISRKIVGEERRANLREIMSEFEIPEGVGYIIRTASAEITHAALEKDLHTLLALWEEVKKRGQTMDAPALVFEEQDTVVRFLRDHFFADIQEILVDTQESLANVDAFIDLLPAKQKNVKVRLHRGTKPIFNQFNIEEQIESIYKPQVALPSGGSIVINPTEALVAIDVNSGRTSKNSDFDDTIFLANMEAAAELARQLRLRDLGGLIVVDFIDMRNKKHIREVERQVKVSMKRDKAKVDISKISRFGLMQISRQKMGAPIEKGSYRTCEYCEGRGVVRSVETLALYHLRRIQTGISRKKVARVECRLPLDVAQYLLNKKRAELADLEAKHQAKIDIIPRVEMKPSENQIDFLETEATR
jgi:ribonuclease E